MSEEFKPQDYSLEELSAAYYAPSTPQEDLGTDLPPQEEDLPNNGEPEFEEEDLPPQEEEPISENEDDLLPPSDEDTNTNVDPEDGSQFQPMTFKANGKEITIDNREDAIRLMQQSFGAQKLVSEYKESRPYVKALNDHGLMNGETLNLIIAAKQGNVAAYKALANTFGISDEQLDDFAYSEDADKEYTPENNIESEETFNLRDTIQELEVSYAEEFPVVRNVINTWDDSSLMAIRQDPSIMSDLSHLQRIGMLEPILADAQKAKTLGRVPNNISDVQLIGSLVNMLSEKAGYNILDRSVQARASTSPQIQDLQANHNPVKQQPKKRQVSHQRRLASGTPERYDGGKTQNSSKQSYDPLTALRESAQKDDDGASVRKNLESILGISFDL